MLKSMITAGTAATLLAACASTGATDDQFAAVSDPFEGFNRAMFSFNAGLDRYAVGPVAKAYETVTPGLFREGVGNFLGNLDEPVTFANQILQGKPGEAIDTFFRFGINTTIGVGGVFDVASRFDLEGKDEDFGQTLGVWGVESGPYIVLPVMGPTTMRDLFGRTVDTAFDPHNQLNWQADYLNNDEDFDRAFRITTGTLGVLNTRIALEEQLQQLNSQPEPYVALRRAYIGAREAAIRDGAPVEDPFEDLPDFESFDDEAPIDQEN